MLTQRDVDRGLEPLAPQLGRAVVRAARGDAAAARAQAASLFAEADSLDMIELDVMYEEVTGRSLVDGDGPVTVEWILEQLRALPADQFEELANALATEGGVA